MPSSLNQTGGLASSTWLQATNSLLGLAQLPLIPDATTFDGGQLTKYQDAAKRFFDLAHRQLSLKTTTNFTNRKFQLPISIGTLGTPSTYQYALDLGINSEALKFHSFYNVTYGSSYATQLPVWKYEDYRTRWPEESQLWLAAPQAVIILPYDRTLDFPHGTPKVQIFPVPDANYNLEYQAKLNFYPLIKNDDLILWPPEYEHALWLWGQQWLEVALSEGREGAIAGFVQEAVNAVHIQSLTSIEVRKAVKLGITMGRRRRFYGGYFG